MILDFQCLRMINRRVWSGQVPTLWAGAMLCLAGAGATLVPVFDRPASAQEAVVEPTGVNETVPGQPAAVPLKGKAASAAAADAGGTVPWLTDFEEAKKLAREQNKDLFLFFTGSDWCGPCIALKGELLNTPEFADRIADKYIPVYLDYPRGKELAEELKQQNQRLKSTFKISAYPTVYITDLELLPHGRFVGYGGPLPTWAKLNTAFQAGTQLRNITNGTAVSSITSPEVLDQVLSAIPTDQLRYGWFPQVERVIAASEAGHPAIKEKWTTTLASAKEDIRDEELVAEATRALQEKRRDRASQEEVLEFLNDGIAQSAGRPVRLRHYVVSKARYLQEQKEYAKALAVVDEILAANWANDSDKLSAKALQLKLFIGQGRVDEGIAQIHKIQAEKEYATQREREIDTKAIIAMELNSAGLNSKALSYLPEVVDNISVIPKRDRAIYFLVDRATSATGTHHALRGQALLAWARFSEERGITADQHDKAALAAVVFRAAGLSDKVAEAAALVNTANDSTTNGAPAKAAKPGVRQPVTSPQDVLKVAKGSQAEALEYLGKQSTSVGGAVYLIEAAFAYRQENQPAKAEELAAQAARLAERFDSRTPDTAAMQHLQSLLKKWSGEVASTR